MYMDGYIRSMSSEFSLREFLLSRTQGIGNDGGRLKHLRSSWRISNYSTVNLKRILELARKVGR